MSGIPLPTTVAAVMGASLLGGSGLWISNQEHHSAIRSKISTVGDDRVSADEMIDGMHVSDEDFHHNLLPGVILGAAALLVAVVVYLLWNLKKSSKAKLGKGILTLTFTKLSGIPKGKLDEKRHQQVSVDVKVQRGVETSKVGTFAGAAVPEEDTLSIDLKLKAHPIDVDFGAAESTELTIEAEVTPSGQSTESRRVVVDLSTYTTTTGSIKLKLYRPDQGVFGRLFAKSMVLEVKTQWTPKL